MNDEPQLAEGYARLVLETANGARTPVLYWRVAEPAPDAPLVPGERVYVDCPKVPGCTYISIQGDGYVVEDHSGVTGLVSVRPSDNGGWKAERIQDAHGVWNVPRAACHREAPQGPPPGEGAHFLGRQGGWDAWWAKYHVHLGGGFASPADIDTSDDRDTPLPNVSEYRAALAVARKLGLVPEAMPDPAWITQIVDALEVQNGLAAAYGGDTLEADVVPLIRACRALAKGLNALLLNEQVRNLLNSAIDNEDDPFAQAFMQDHEEADKALDAYRSGEFGDDAE